jgi:general secretion pathway protein D
MRSPTMENFRKYAQLAALIGGLPFLFGLGGCAELSTLRTKPGPQHLGMGPQPVTPAGVPQLVRLPLLPPVPVPRIPQELLSVVVNDVPLRNLLFALAQEQQMNVDIHPGVLGKVTMNATDQTLLQIMDRLAVQGDIRYEITGNLLKVVPDAPYMAHYTVDYVNLQRQSKSSIQSNSQINSSSGGGGGSTTQTESSTQNEFWTSLIQNMCVLASSANYERQIKDNKALTEQNNAERDARLRIAQELTKTAPSGTAGGNPMLPPQAGGNSSDLLRQVLGPTVVVDKETMLAKCSGGGGAAGTTSSSIKSPDIMVNRETGQISVNTTALGHANVRKFVDRVVASARRQVLIEATIVEITLNNGYQQGINWSELVTGGLMRGLKFQVGPVGTGAFSAAQDAAMGLFTYKSAGGDLVAAINLLETFGQARVLSSPKISTLNNQMAQIKVVDDYVYVTIDFTPGTKSTSGGVTTVITPDTYTSNVKTVPVGFVMSVTPQISETGEVTLNVRPVISRVVREINDPNPALRQFNPPIINKIPIIQTREMESVMRIQGGEIAVLGGLMQDAGTDGEDAVPGLRAIPGVGELFKQKTQSRTKSELVVFLRPVVVQDASIRGDYKGYKSLLPGEEMFGRNAQEEARWSRNN